MSGASGSLHVTLTSRSSPPPAAAAAAAAGRTGFTANFSFVTGTNIGCRDLHQYAESHANVVTGRQISFVSVIVITIIIVIIGIFLVRLLQYEHRCITAVDKNIKNQKF